MQSQRLCWDFQGVLKWPIITFKVCKANYVPLHVRDPTLELVCNMHMVDEDPIFQFGY